MGDIKLLGFYKELWPENPNYVGSIYEALRTVEAPWENSIIDYLEHGNPVIDWMEGTTDVFNKDKGIPGGSSILTDGAWIWRRDLVYYVRAYHVRADREFCRWVGSNNYQMPVVDDARHAVIFDEVRCLGV